MPLLALDPRGALLPLERAPVAPRGSHGGRSVFVTHSGDSDSDGDPVSGPGGAAEGEDASVSDPASELASVAKELAKLRATEATSTPDADVKAADVKAGLDAFARACFESVENAMLEGTPVQAQFRLLHGGAYGAVQAEGAFASAAALASALEFVRKLPTFCEADAAAVIVPKAQVQYPHVWYASLSWPDQLGVDAQGVFVEIHGRSAHAHTATWFLPNVGGVLSEAVRLPGDCALLEASLFDKQA